MQTIFKESKYNAINRISIENDVNNYCIVFSLRFSCKCFLSWINAAWRKQTKIFIVLINSINWWPKCHVLRLLFCKINSIVVELNLIKLQWNHQNERIIWLQLYYIGNLVFVFSTIKMFQWEDNTITVLKYKISETPTINVN